MSGLEKVELGVIALLVICSYFFTASFAETVTLGLGLVWIAGLIFVQSLIRDLVFMVIKKRQLGSQVEQHCFCLESLLGVSVLLAGFLLFFSGATFVIAMNKAIYALCIFLTLVVGFLIKDLVFTWKPVGIRREKNHMNIIVKW